MTVVHVVDRVLGGHGRGITALEIAQAQHRAGWDVRLLVSGVRSPELLPAAPAPEPLFGEFTGEVYRDVRSIGRVAVALERATFTGDTIVSHSGIDLAAGARLTGRILVAAVHSDPANHLGYLPPADLAALVQRTDRWVAWGGAIADRLAALGVVPSRITISAQSATANRPVAQRMIGRPACISVARIHPVKNHELILEALVILARSHPAVRWHMVGRLEDEAYFGRLRITARRLGVSHVISWHGYRPDVLALVRGSHVAVLASHSEGVPRAIQEAMVLGVPTVLPAALARDLSHAGLPVGYHRQEPQALAEAVTAALRVDPRRLTAAARWVERRWGWAAVLADWQRVLGGGPPGLAAARRSAGELRLRSSSAPPGG
jgi:hypothetical protein